MIPGVNDLHLAAVVREVRRRSAFLVNLMPLVSEAAPPGTGRALLAAALMEVRELPLGEGA